MRDAIITTSSGDIKKSPGELVVVLGEEPREEYACNLKGGERILFKTTYRPRTFPELEEFLYQTLPEYRELRDILYVRYTREAKTYEVPRIRYHLLKSALERAPEVFKEEEIEQFDDFLFRVDGMEFSRDTLLGAVSYINGICSDCGYDYHKKTPMHWLMRNVYIDPRNPERAAEIASCMHNEEFIAQAEVIRDLPKGENPYFGLVDAHARYARMFELNNSGKRKGIKRYGDRRPRVHRSYLNWDEEINRCLDSTERIEEATVLGKPELVKRKPGVRKRERRKRKRSFEPKIPSGLVTVGDGERRKEVYGFLNFKKEPRPKEEVIQERLSGSIALLKEIYQEALPYLLEFDEARRGVLGTEKKPQKADMCFMDYITPVSRYSVERHIRYQMWLNKRMRRLLGEDITGLFEGFPLLWRLGVCSQKSRKAYRKMLRNTLPDGHPFRDMLSRLYEESPMVRSSMNEETFIRGMSADVREGERKMFHGLKAIKMLGDKGLMKWSKEASAHYKRLGDSIKVDGKISGKVNEIKRIDSEIPPELASFRVTKKRPRSKARTNPFMKSSFRRYGIDANKSLIVPFENMMSEFEGWAKGQESDKLAVKR